VICVAALNFTVGLFAEPAIVGFDLVPMTIGIALLMLPAAGWAVALPHIRVGFMAQAWHVPRATLLVSRPLLKIIGTSATGSLIGFALLIPFRDVTHSALTAGMVPSVVLFAVSAKRRMRRHPNSEFAMPTFPHPFHRRVKGIRKFTR
jgi:hypothetical protein